MSQELPTRSKFRNQYVDVIEEAMRCFPENHRMIAELSHAATELNRLHRRVLAITATEGYVPVPVLRGAMYVCPTCHGVGSVTQQLRDQMLAARSEAP